MKQFVLILFIHFLMSASLFSQTRTIKNQQYEMADGDEYLNIGNYVTALEIYQELYKTLPNNRELNYKLALCLLNTHTNRTEAIQYLEFVTKEEKFATEAWYHLGIAYALDYKLDNAIAALKKFKNLVPKQAKLAEQRIEQCNRAKALMKHPVNVSFANLGKEINSSFPDYYPWITKDETTLAFTSRRKGNIGGMVEGDGYYPSDIYTSSANNGKWDKTKNIGPMINTAMDEQVVGLKADGSELIIYIDHYEVFGDLYSSKKKGTTFQKMQPLNEKINKKLEFSGSVSEDGNHLFFIRKETEKETSDIYQSKKLPSGEWAEPQKLPNTINTAYNEEFPYLAPDGKTLYFSSEGHNSMGGFDLFKSVWNEEQNTWTEAENLGYPINTTDDDKSISISADNTVGYISALRPSGFGDLDIYRIKFKQAEEKFIIYKGIITYSDSIKKPKENIVSIIATEKTSNEEYSFTPHPKNGSFIMALPEGEYNISISAEGYKETKETLIVAGVGANNTERKKDYKLVK